MRSGHFFSQFLAGGVHGFAANGGGHCGFHHQFSEMARGLVERCGGIADGIEVFAELDRCE